MPRARCAESIEAEKLYRSGMKLVDIAHKMNVPQGTVRRWKSDQDWDGKKGVDGKKKQTERSDSKPNARKRGAQPGNTNSSGGPAGNLKAVKHGAFMRIYEDLLTDEEKGLLPEFSEQTERERLIKILNLHQLNERRLMKRINDIENGADMLTFKTMSTVEPTGKKGADGREITKVVKISQEQKARDDTLVNFIDALNRIRAEIRRTTDSIRQLDEADTKTIMTETTQSLVDAMTEAYDRRGGEADE